MGYIDTYTLAYMIGAALIVICSGFLMNVFTESIQTIHRANEEKAKREKKAKKENLDKAS